MNASAQVARLRATVAGAGGRASRERAAGCAREVCRLLGVPGTDLVRLRAGSTSWVYDAPAAKAVIIVARPGVGAVRLAARCEAAVALSSRLSFVRPHDQLPRPVSAGGLHATVWRREDRIPGPPSWQAVGRTVRALHEVPPGALPAALDLRRHLDLGYVEPVLAELRGRGLLAGADARVLLQVSRRLGDEMAAVEGVMSLVHGDLHRGNVLTVQGGCVLCDTDELGIAWPAYDLAFLVDETRPDRLTGADSADFERGYGDALPSPLTARTLARVAHLRRTVDDLGTGEPTVRDRWWTRARLDAWSAMQQDWSRDLQPVLGQSRARHLQRLGLRLRMAVAAKRPGTGSTGGA